MNEAVSLADFFSQPIPGELWHYTSISALKGITASQTVFATAARHTTDLDEFVHAHQVAKDFLARNKSHTTLEQRLTQAGHDILNMAFGEDGPLSANNHPPQLDCRSRSKRRASSCVKHRQ